MKVMQLLLSAVLYSFLTVSALAGPVNINSANAHALGTLNGIGPKTAQAIVQYRTKNGPFKTVEDLANVKGIGVKIVEKNRTNMTVK